MHIKNTDALINWLRIKRTAKRKNLGGAREKNSTAKIIFFVCSVRSKQKPDANGKRVTKTFSLEMERNQRLLISQDVLLE